MEGPHKRAGSQTPDSTVALRSHYSAAIASSPDSGAEAMNQVKTTVVENLQ
ncbi:unnamed protein product, partial [Nesidiocoris tenuis]